MGFDHERRAHRGGGVYATRHWCDDLAVRPSKHRRKANRRAVRYLDEAWRAYEEGEPALARKIAARAVAAAPGNPRLCNEQGLLLQALGAIEEAACAFRLALKLAPDYAEAERNLATLAAAGDAHAAPAPALEIDPGNEPSAPAPPAPAPEPLPPPRLSPRFGRYVWDRIEQELLQSGGVVLAALLDATEREALCLAMHDDEVREFTVALADDERGRVERSILRTPRIAPLEHLRAESYVPCAAIANRWTETVGRRERFPLTLAELHARCRSAGQLWAASALLEFPPAGFCGLRREPSQVLQFPFQLFVDLGPDADWCEHRLVDLRPGKRLHERTFRTRPGDGLLLCARDRLDRVAGVYGLQAVMHGISAGDGCRQVLQVAFEDRR